MITRQSRSNHVIRKTDHRATRRSPIPCRTKRLVVNYVLRQIDPELWEAVKARAAEEGRSLRFVLLALLRAYAKHGFSVVENARRHD